MKKPSDPTRIVDVARALPIVGAFLLMPPIIALFAIEADIDGVPLVVVYLFGIWFSLIVCAALLARRLAPPTVHDRGRGDNPHG